MKEKQNLEIQLKKEINYILNNIKEIDVNNYTYKYVNNFTDSELDLKKSIDSYNYYTKLIKIIIVILIISLCTFMVCVRYVCNDETISGESDKKEIQMTNLVSDEQSFSKLSTDENA
jgi:flagellar basal body-associated protein FliL